MFFFLSGEFSLKGYLFMSIYYIFAALAAAVSKAAQFSDGKDFSRKSVLTAETVIRLLIGAEGGSLAKILHDAGIQATASALKSRPQYSVRLLTVSTPLVRTANCFAVIAYLQ